MAWFVVHFHCSRLAARGSRLAAVTKMAGNTNLARARPEAREARLSPLYLSLSLSLDTDTITITIPSYCYHYHYHYRIAPLLLRCTLIQYHLFHRP